LWPGSVLGQPVGGEPNQYAGDAGLEGILQVPRGDRFHGGLVTGRAPRRQWRSASGMIASRLAEVSRATEDVSRAHPIGHSMQGAIRSNTNDKPDHKLRSSRTDTDDSRGAHPDEHDGRRVKIALNIERYHPEGMNVRMSGGQPPY
jgi:hypothetical protein